MSPKEGSLRVEELKPSQLAVTDPRVSTTSEHPVTNDARRTVAAAVEKSLGVDRERFLSDLGRVASRRKPKRA